MTEAGTLGFATEEKYMDYFVIQAKRHCWKPEISGALGSGLAVLMVCSTRQSAGNIKHWNERVYFLQS